MSPYDVTRPQWFNTSCLWWCDCDHKCLNIKHHLGIDILSIQINITGERTQEDIFDDKSTLYSQAMAWYCQATSHHLSQYSPTSIAIWHHQVIMTNELNSNTQKMNTLEKSDHNILRIHWTGAICTYLTYSWPHEPISSWDPRSRNFRQSRPSLIVIPRTDTTSAQNACNQMKISIFYQLEITKQGLWKYIDILHETF